MPASIVGDAKLARAPDGSVLTLDDLPQTVHRWVASHKAILVCALNELLTTEQVLARYPGLTEDEIQVWRAAYAMHGVRGLRSSSLLEHT